MTYKGNEIPGWVKVFIALISIATIVGATLSTFVTKTDLEKAVSQEKIERIRMDEKNEEYRREDMKEIREKLDRLFEAVNKKQNRKDP